MITRQNHPTGFGHIFLALNPGAEKDLEPRAENDCLNNSVQHVPVLLPIANIPPKPKASAKLENLVVLSRLLIIGVRSGMN